MNKQERLKHLLNNYGESHQNKINIIIHKICVPLIMFSIIGLLYSIPSRFYMDWAAITLLVAMSFYSTLGQKVLSAMVLVYGIMYLLVVFLSSQDNFFALMFTIFALSWVGQFIGHKVEGKKPSFMEDLKYLLVGPVWVFKRFLK